MDSSSADSQVHTYRPIPLVCCLPHIHILTCWLPPPSAWHARAFLGNKQTNKQTEIKRGRRERERRWKRPTMMHAKKTAKEYQQTHRGPRCKVTHPVSCTNTGVQTDTQTHRGMTTLRQATDDYLVALGPLSSDLAEWLQIWAKPLCKSTLKPTSPPDPPSLSTSSNHSSPANNALHNQHQA